MDNTIPGIKALRDTLQAKSEALKDVVKIGRTHFMDATPLTVGQELSGYVSQIDHGIRAIKNTLPHLGELARHERHEPAGALGVGRLDVVRDGASLCPLGSGAFNECGVSNRTAARSCG